MNITPVKNEKTSYIHVCTQSHAENDLPTGSRYEDFFENGDERVSMVRTTERQAT